MLMCPLRSVSAFTPLYIIQVAKSNITNEGFAHCAKCHNERANAKCLRVETVVL